MRLTVKEMDQCRYARKNMKSFSSINVTSILGFGKGWVEKSGKILGRTSFLPLFISLFNSTHSSSRKWKWGRCPSIDRAAKIANELQTYLRITALYKPWKRAFFLWCWIFYGSLAQDIGSLDGYDGVSCLKRLAKIQEFMGMFGGSNLYFILWETEVALLSSSRYRYPHGSSHPYFLRQRHHFTPLL